MDGESLEQSEIKCGRNPPKQADECEPASAVAILAACGAEEVKTFRPEGTPGLKTGRYNGTRTQRPPPIATTSADIEGSSQFILGLDAMR